MSLISELSDWKRDYLSDICLNECQANCCRDMFFYGNLDLSLFPEGSIMELEDQLVGVPVYHMRGVCQLQDPETKKCTIYEERPKACREFPISTNESQIVISRRCCVGTQFSEGMDTEAIQKLKEIAARYHRELSNFDNEPVSKKFKEARTHRVEVLDKYGMSNRLFQSRMDRYKSLFRSRRF